MVKGILIQFIVCFVSGTLTLAIGASAQETGTTTVHNPTKKVTTNVEPVAIGEKVPEIVFENVLNYKKRKVKLSEFRGKLVILDMWSTTCTSCIGAFPKVEKLQNEFKDKVQILLVNPHTGKYDSESRIKTILQSLKTRTGYYPNLPIPIHDSIISYYFPHKSVPHYIWINGNGELLAISRAMDVTRENISSILAGNKVRIRTKNDWGYDSETPMLVDGNGGENGEFLYRALFTEFKDGIGFGTGLRTDKEGNVIGFYMLNKPLREFVAEAYLIIMNNVKRNRMAFEVKNPSNLEWKLTSGNLYCYDLTIPPVARGQFDVSTHLREDLKRFFNLRAFSEKRKVKCFVVTTLPGASVHPTKYTEQDLLLDQYSKRKYIHNYSVAEIISFLDQFDIPFIDETAKSQFLTDIDFKSDFNQLNIDSVIKELRSVGFEVKIEERELDTIVITDK